MKPKYLSEEVIVHPNHHMTFGDWIPRACLIFQILMLSDAPLEVGIPYFPVLDYPDITKTGPNPWCCF